MTRRLPDRNLYQQQASYEDAMWEWENNPLYGWIRVNGGPTQGFPATIVDWAYEDSGGGILTGATQVPEPSSLALGFLAAGAAGVAAWRRRKAA